MCVIFLIHPKHTHIHTQITVHQSFYALNDTQNMIAIIFPHTVHKLAKIPQSLITTPFLCLSFFNQFYFGTTNHKKILTRNVPKPESSLKLKFEKLFNPKTLPALHPLTPPTKQYKLTNHSFYITSSNPVTTP